ncbi:hypothetical protein CLV98_104118 [Dyadobacter jejuensis]|uniref:DinB family protein n=1 Tax=Dyadobacter jejuensis TaxID=1082580 RepID=A0A316ANA1_9BACT|nr:hypothetical protein [Dyadobacter jejuensis]PWJ58260.1 hypothetical protein CLV98_104118 [Dyadobacter jejuensis]
MTIDTSVSKKLDIIIPAYRMHSQSFRNALDGISEEAALRRMDNNTNHVVWMAGNLVNCRYWIGNLLGIDDKDPYEHLFNEARALDENFAYPTLEELKDSFAIISPKVYEMLLIAPDELLEMDYPFGMNVSFVKENVLNMIGMCIGREDYLLGQIGLMRKLLGLKGMRYDIDDSLSY